MKVVINNCFGGFGLSDLAYKELIKLGIPVRKYRQEPRNPKTGLYDIKVPENEGEVIFDRELSPASESSFSALYHQYKEKSGLYGRYWDTWTRENRSHHLIIKVVKKLGKKASGQCAELKIIEIPDGTNYTIEEYDGLEHIAEKHKTWN